MIEMSSNPDGGKESNCLHAQELSYPYYKEHVQQPER